MEALIYFLLWGALLFVVMRFVCGAHLLGRHDNKSKAGERTDALDGSRWVAPKRATDPVCGTSILTVNAKPSVFDGRAYYFCSRDCREIFEAAPEFYLGGGRQIAKPPMERSHV